MRENLYELVALGARYFFVALMLLIVIRAWRIAIIDSRRAAKLRRWAPETGVIGEFQVLDGDERARKGMVYPVIREGLIGRSRKADIRLRSHSVHVRHAYFEMAADGLRLRTVGAARMDAGQGRARHIALKDGDTLLVGRVRLMLVLSGTPAEEPPRERPPRRPARSGEDLDDEWFETDPDRLFETQPVLRRLEDRREI